MLAIFLVTFFFAIVMVGAVVESERTGRAHYSDNPRLPDKLLVTRTHEPAQFNKTIGVMTFRALFYGSLAFASFSFYRRLSN